jgi:hypothetical protein
VDAGLDAHLDYSRKAGEVDPEQARRLGEPEAICCCAG